MRVCFVNCPNTFELIGNDPVIIKDQQGTYPPLGILSIAGYLQEHTDHELMVVDAQVEDLTHAQVADRVAEFRPDVVGLTVMTFTLIDCKKTIEEIRKRVKTLVVVGGPHTAIYPSESLGGLCADYCIVGEGEITFKLLLEDIALGRAYAQVYRQERFIENLDEIPYPARELTPIEKYYSVLAEETPTTTAFSSRGCPYQCTFCLKGDTKILMSDFTWKNIRSISVGESVLGVKKVVNERTIYEHTKVTHVFPPRVADTYEIKTDKGSVYATSEHPWLTSHNRWRNTTDLKASWGLRYLSSPIEDIGETTDYKRGYLVGAFAGDGYVKAYKNPNRPTWKYLSYRLVLCGDTEMMDTALIYGNQIGLPLKKTKFNNQGIFKNLTYKVSCYGKESYEFFQSLKNYRSWEFYRGYVAGYFDAEGSCTSALRFHNYKVEELEYVGNILSVNGFSYNIKKVSSGKAYCLTMLGGKDAMIRFVAMFRPKVMRKLKQLKHISVRGRANIQSVTRTGKIECVYNIETQNHTYIANGFVSHNCDRPALGKSFRFQSANRVVDEMEWCEKRGIKEIFFYDDTFTVKKDRVHSICSEYERRHLKVKWDVRARVNTVDEPLLKALQRCNVTRIHFGVESAVPRILQELNKGINPDQVYRAFDACKRLGIKTLAYFMMGTPTETLEDVKENLRMAKRIQADYMQMTILSMFPGTKIYDIAKKEGLVDGDPWLEYVKNPKEGFRPPMWETIYSKEEHETHLRWFYKRFYLRPRFLLDRLLEIRNFPQFNRYFSAGVSLIRMSFQKESKVKLATDTIRRLGAETPSAPVQVPCEAMD